MSGRLQGAVDQADTTRIAGWLRDAADFARPMLLDLLRDGVALARFSATPVGEGASLRHVFHLAPTRLLMRGPRTRFAIRDAVTGADLPGSPFEITDGAAITLPLRRTGRPVAVFIDDRPPAPWLDGGSTVALSHIRALRALGYSVTFLALAAPEAGSLAAARAAGAWCPQARAPWPAEALLGHLTPAPALVYLHKFPAAAHLLPWLRLAVPGARIVHAVADLHWLRLERGGAAREEVARQRALETALLTLPDAVVVHSTVEAALIGGIVRAVAVVPWAMPIRPPPAFTGRRGWAFVGGFDHAPNLDAAHFLAAEVAPLLAGGPAGTVYGSAMPEALRAQGRPGLRMVGAVPNIVDRLHRHRATVAPLRFGAGVKVKVVQSLACGLPCVMTPIAAEGLELPAVLTQALVREGAPALARALRALCADAPLNAAVAVAGMRHVRGRFSAAATRAALRGVVEAGLHLS